MEMNGMMARSIYSSYEYDLIILEHLTISPLITEQIHSYTVKILVTFGHYLPMGYNREMGLDVY